MNDKDWQARAELIALDYALVALETKCSTAILNFAKEFSADLRAEVERLGKLSTDLSADLKLVEAENEALRKCVDFDAVQLSQEANDLRAQLAKCNSALAATMAVENDLRAQLAAMPLRALEIVSWSRNDYNGKIIDSLERDLKAGMHGQLAAATDAVKVPDEKPTRPICGEYAYGWNACRAEVLRLNAPPKENG